MDDGDLSQLQTKALYCLQNLNPSFPVDFRGLYDPLLLIQDPAPPPQFTVFGCPSPCYSLLNLKPDTFFTPPPQSQWKRIHEKLLAAFFYFLPPFFVKYSLVVPPSCKRGSGRLLRWAPFEGLHQRLGAPHWFFSIARPSSPPGFCPIPVSCQNIDSPVLPHRKNIDILLSVLPPFCVRGLGAEHPSPPFFLS